MSASEVRKLLEERRKEEVWSDKFVLESCDVRSGVLNCTLAHLYLIGLYVEHRDLPLP